MRVTIVGLALLLASSIAPAQSEPVRGDSIPRIVQKIQFGEYGSKVVRMGDLDGDGRVDLLLIQAKAPEGENKTIITCLTAITLEGKVLWQIGTPDLRNNYFAGDFSVEIHDLDGDGKAEVVYIPDEKNELHILAGATGKEIRKVQLAGGHDSLLFADLSGNGRATDLVVKNRYTSFWVYDRFALTWL